MNYKPMIPGTAKPFDKKQWLFEVFWDGVRCIASVDKIEGTVNVSDEKGNDMLDLFPELEELLHVSKDSCILDGQIMVRDTEGKPLHKDLKKRLTAKGVSREDQSAWNPAVLIVFDILNHDGDDMTKKPLKERKHVLEETLLPSVRVLKSVFLEEEGKQFFKSLKMRGFDGMVGKDMNSPYLPGKKTKDWLVVPCRTKKQTKK